MFCLVLQIGVWEMEEPMKKLNGCEIGIRKNIKLGKEEEMTIKSKRQLIK